jgi:hypothetical protein
MMKRLAILAFVVLGVVLGAVAADAQGVQQQRPGRAGRQAQQSPAAADDSGVTPAELQRMFDAYALVQAQDQLRLNDDQYSRFLIRFKSLQDIRRKALQEHTKLVVELRRLLTQGQSDDSQLKDRMQALQDVDTRAIADVKKAYEAIDQALDVKQQAGFRVFEEQMERRKIELITRARQANRPKQQQ